MTSRAHARQDHALMLHLACLSYQQIADAPDPTASPLEPAKLYASAGSARNAVLAARVRHGGNVDASDITGNERRSILNDRWERLLRTWMPKSIGGDEEAAKIVVRALRGQAELYGLNMRPAAVPLEMPGGEEDPVDELARARAERLANARSAATAAVTPPG